jgi:type IV pilus assembly protein PilM
MDWNKEISFRRKRKELAAEASETAAPAQGRQAPASPAPAARSEPPDYYAWLSAELEAAEAEHRADPPVEQPPVAPPSAPVPAPPAPAPGVHPPVPAAELPPLPAEEKQSLLKRDISFRRKPKAEKPPKEPRRKRAREPKPAKAAGESKGKQKRLVGLKIGASQLAAARVANNGFAELQQVAREPLDPGIIVGGELREPEALAEALKLFFRKHKLPKRGVRLGIANNRIGVRTFEITGIADPKQLANAVRFRAQEALPIPIEEAVLDYQVLSEGVDEQGEPVRRVLLVVAYRELIDRYVNACRKAGITLAGIDLEAFALLRSLSAPQPEGTPADAAVVVVAVGHERSTFAVSDGRSCEFTRVLEWGGSSLNVAVARELDISPPEAEPVKRAISLLDQNVPEGLTFEQASQAREAIRRQIQSFARELVSSLQFYQNQPGSLGIGEIILTGGTAHLAGLGDELQSLIGVRVAIGDPLGRVRLAKRLGDPEQVGSLTVAIGLGIED